jgi:glycosyltransferase involved in cell wall biosynthesis
VAGLEEHVVFTGWVPHDAVASYYSLMEILVYPRLPYRLVELTTPLKPLEAMAQGKVVVASDVGGHRELIRHGENGLLFRAGDVGSLAATLLKALRAPDGGAQLRSAGRRYVETERTWWHSVGRYEDVYGALVGKLSPR